MVVWDTDPNSEFRINRHKANCIPEQPGLAEAQCTQTDPITQTADTIPPVGLKVPNIDEVQRDEQTSQSGNKEIVDESKVVLECLAVNIKPSVTDAIVNAGDIPDQNVDTPQRDRIIGNLAATDTVGGLAAPGGTGKSLFLSSGVVAVSTGKQILGDHLEVPKRRKVLYMSNEDPEQIVYQRLSAIYLQHGITKEETKDYLFVRSGYGYPFRVAKTAEKESAVNMTSQVNEIIRFCIEHEIEFIAADPYVSLHDVPENNNTLQNQVMDIFKYINAETKAGILIATHVPKTDKDSEARAGDMDAIRGASAIKDGMRAVHTLSAMSEKTMDKNGIEYASGNSLIRLDDAKQNYGPKSWKVHWYQLKRVRMPNGESCAVPVPVDLEPLCNSTPESKASMTATKWVEVMEREVGEDIKKQSSFMYSDVKTRLVEASDWGTSKVAEFVTLLSMDENRPTRIKVDGHLIDYWVKRESSQKRAPWIVYRKELS
jgi:hypothetical protein